MNPFLLAASHPIIVPGAKCGECGSARHWPWLCRGCGRTTCEACSVRRRTDMPCDGCLCDRAGMDAPEHEMEWLHRFDGGSWFTGRVYVVGDPLNVDCRRNPLLWDLPEPLVRRATMYPIRHHVLGPSGPASGFAWIGDLFHPLTGLCCRYVMDEIGRVCK